MIWEAHQEHVEFTSPKIAVQAPGALILAENRDCPPKSCEESQRTRGVLLIPNFSLREIEELTFSR